MRKKKKLRQKLGGADLELPKIRKNPLIEIYSNYKRLIKNIFYLFFKI